MNARSFAAILTLGLFASLAPTSCATLPDVARGQCGNFVVEAGEECDEVAPAGQRCRKANEPGACRFDCSGANKCPNGWVCGPSDQLCRQSTGTFTDDPVTTVETTAARLLAADLDGDGKQELVALSAQDDVGRVSPRVFFFGDVNAGAAKSLAVRATVVSPVLADMDGDGLADVVASSLDGVNLFLGKSDRTLAPVAFARFPLPPGSTARITRIEGYRGFAEFPMVFGDAGGRKAIAPAAVEGDPFEAPIAPLDRPPSQILGEPVPANLIEGATSTCDELVWAWVDSDHLLMVAPCGPTNDFVKFRPGDPSPIKKILTLPDGDVIDRPPVAADLNGDGHLDLMVQGVKGGYVAFGKGDGTFSSKPDLTGPPQVAKLECAHVDFLGKPVSAAAAPCPAPIAASNPPGAKAELNQLLVLPNEILRVRKVEGDGAKVRVSALQLASQTTSQWTSAKIADFNANGIPDVIAGSRTAPDLDFFNGAPFGLLNPSKVTTEGPVLGISFGDYDGDLVRDVAIIEQNVGGFEIDAVSVAFGRTMAPPETPFRVGLFPRVRQLATARLGLTATTLESLGVVYSDPAADQIALLEGGGARQLLSPFGLADVIDPTPGKKPDVVQAVVFGLAVGQFDDDPRPDLAAIALDRDELLGTRVHIPRLWLTPGAAGGRFGASKMTKPIEGIGLGSPLGSGADAGGAVVNVLRTADLDGDGKSELVALLPTKFPKVGALLLVAKAVKRPDGYVLDVKSTTILQETFFPQRASDLRLGDVDGDGKIDAVVFMNGSKQETALLVLFGDGTGKFDVPSAAAIKEPKDSGAFHGFTLVQADSDAPLEIAAVTNKASFLVQPTGNAGRTLAITPLQGFSGGQSIGALDVDGDGVQDLAVGDGPRVSIHLGVPKQK